MQKKLAVIINPAAGRGHYVTVMSSVLELLCKKGYCITIYLTKKQGDAATIVHQHAEEYEILICCGGDGTLSETVNGLIKLKNPPPLGYIPIGTTNDFANSLSLPKNQKKAVELILTAEPAAIDMGQFGDVYFSYIAAFGVFTDVSYTTPQKAKNTMGQLAYIVEGLSRLGNIPVYHTVIEHDQGTIEDDFIFAGVTNSLSVAGLVKFDPSVVNLKDGLFEVLLIKPPKNIADYPKIIGGILTRRYDPECIIFLHSSALTCRLDRAVSWTIDGENGGRHKEVTIRNLPGSLTILV